MMHYTQNKKHLSYISTDEVLDAAEYGLAVAGVMGADTTAADLALCAGQAGRLFLAPETVKKPQNETTKILASLACIAFGGITGYKRAASAAELVAMGFIDATIDG